jgi:ABC-type sugar transport system substrate-binding protein/UDP-2,3-diacylglucosamine pyrophosphatase LpxH
MNERDFVVILSDIHIGTKKPSVWYQKDIHEKYLTAIFDDIIEQAKQIQEVVLLGDIFEFWTYEPSELPPTMDEIIAEHPQILGIDGKLRKALSALEGRMVFVPGNHDMNVTQLDLNKMRSLDGYIVKIRPGAYIPSYDTQIKFVHGHEFTFLNAPYYKSKLAPIPIGYFLHKAFSYKLYSDIKRTPGITVASLDEYGTYSLLNYLSKATDCLEKYEKDFDFINKFIDSIADYTGIPKDLNIKVNRNTAVTLREVKKIYKNLDTDFYQLYIKKGLKVQTVELKNLVESRIEEIPWYLKKNKAEKGNNILVMGHSHCPYITIGEDNITYVNVGFMCPSISNLRITPITYGIYNISNRNMKLMNVSGSNNPIKIMPYMNQTVNQTVNKTVSKQNKEAGVLLNKILVENMQENRKKENDITLPTKYTFGWSVFNASLEFWQEMQMGVLSKAEELGIDIILHDEKSNSVEMIVGSIDLINKQVDALIIAPYNPELLPVIVEEAQMHNIPVVSIDIGTGGADVAAFIVSDSFGGGVFAGEYGLQLIKKYEIKSKNIAIIKVQKTAPYALLRGEGFKSVMVGYGYKVVAEAPGNSEELLAYEVMKSILTIYKDDLAIVFCENGTMTLGAARAIEEAGKKGVIMLVGFDSGPSIIEGIKAGSIQGTIGQQPFKMGQIGVEIANSVLMGIPVSFDDWTQKLVLMEVFLVNESGEIQRGVV